MNKWFLGLMSMAFIGGLVYAQESGGRVNVPGFEREGRQNLGAMRGLGGGSITATANEKNLFVVSNGTVYKFDVVSLSLVGQAKLPVPDRGEGVRRNPQPPID